MQWTIPYEVQSSATFEKSAFPENFTCDQCIEQFLTKSTLVRHLKKVQHVVESGNRKSESLIN